MTITMTILGCGSSGGVPRVGNDWGKCDPANPKNRRRRCSVLLEKTTTEGTTRVLIDTSPDLREQMLSTTTIHLDAVWFTHEHADHTHGIDELRAFYLMQRNRIPVYADEATAAILKKRFAYCFEQTPGSDYPAILALHELKAGRALEASGAGGNIIGLPFMVHHGNINAYGFRIGNTAYVPDLNGIPDESIAPLSGLDLLVIDALRRTKHPSHFSLPETLDWIKRLAPKRVVITNMHVDLDYEALRNELPDHIEPAYDGMKLVIDKLS
jgi:phosphoribosyl 1,2-cyclic phosphate phosphodiesterase